MSPIRGVILGFILKDHADANLFGILLYQVVSSSNSLLHFLYINKTDIVTI